MTLHRKLSNKKTRLRICTIEDVTVETPTIKTFFFQDEMVVKGGQFIMVWVPGVDEVPMSVSYSGAKKGITVANVGDATSKLHEFSVSAKLGIRGPYGNGFDISSATRILAVAGGCGSAPIGPVLDDAVNQNMEIKFVLGARTSAELVFKKRAQKLGIDLDISTDDGTEGHHGFVTELVDEILDSENYDLLVACGPEPMLMKLLELATKNNIPLQASLERYMKCGIGICDACSINGFQVCRDGPVFTGEILANLSEFGKYQRDACGKVIDV
jgi:dihydroorotate dehydrogenase electron transfer subunit